MADQPERKQINFTIVPDETGAPPRVYANFCAISHTPFDFTLAFCEVLPLSDKDIQAGNTRKVVDLVEQKVLPHIDFAEATKLADRMVVMNLGGVVGRQITHAVPGVVDARELDSILDRAMDVRVEAELRCRPPLHLGAARDRAAAAAAGRTRASCPSRSGPDR